MKEQGRAVAGKDADTFIDVYLNLCRGLHCKRVYHYNKVYLSIYLYAVTSAIRMQTVFV